MTPFRRFAPTAFVMLFWALSSVAQTYQIKSIQFKGASEYTDAELSAAADLKKGVALTTPQLNDHAKLLMDTGLFQNASFKFNGQDLLFELTPVPQLYAVRLENIPVSIQTGLEDRLHARFPLYRGNVPVSGGLVDGIQKELEDELAAAGIKATVAVTPFTDLALGKVTAISFAITDPDIQVGQIQLQGASAAFADKAKAVLAKTVGSAYSFDGTVSLLQTNLTNFYGAQGYLRANIHAVAQPDTVVDANGVHVPFLVTVDEGLQYRLAGVQLAPGLIVSQADFDKVSGLHLGDVVSLVKLRANWELLSHLYHNHGYMRSEIRPVATFDQTAGTVSYSVGVEPGPVYTTGKIRVRNASDELRAAILGTLKLTPGEPFNEGAIRSMLMTKSADPALQRVLGSYNLSYTASRHEDVHTIDVDITAEPRHP